MPRQSINLLNIIRRFLEEHVGGLLERVRGTAPLENNDPHDGLLDRYVSAWREYSEGVAYLNSLYSYLNLQHVRRQKDLVGDHCVEAIAPVSDAEIIYGSAATVAADSESRQLEVGELGLVIWERVLMRGLAPALSARIVAALNEARRATPDPQHAGVLHSAIHSAVHVQSFRVRAPLSLYEQLVLEPYLEQAGAAHAQLAADLLREGDISHYMQHVLQGRAREVALGARFLHASSADAVRSCYERAAVAAHLPTLHAECPALLARAADTRAAPQVHGALPTLHAECPALLARAADTRAAPQVHGALPTLHAECPALLARAADTRAAPQVHGPCPPCAQSAPPCWRAPRTRGPPHRVPRPAGARRGHEGRPTGTRALPTLHAECPALLARAADTRAAPQVHGALPTLHAECPALLARAADTRAAPQVHGALPTLHAECPALLARAADTRAAPQVHGALPTLHAECPALLARAADTRAAPQVHGAPPTLHAECPALLARAADTRAAPQLQDLQRLYTLLKPLGTHALRPLVDAAHAQAAQEGRALLAQRHARDEAHAHFVTSMVSLHAKYSALFSEVFDNNQAFVGALDRACAGVVNARDAGNPPRAPELLARYCDALLRRRGGGGESEPESRLAAAILVFKYIDDKDVFQKYYARALARRLIHQLSASMEQEEAMINRLKAACGYEFTNKLHRMFTDVAVSADLNNKFQQHLREQQPPAPAMPGFSVQVTSCRAMIAWCTGTTFKHLWHKLRRMFTDVAVSADLNNKFQQHLREQQPPAPAMPGFSVQVLQAGAWPLGGAMAPLAPPAALERVARQFEAFYRASFSGRRLAWLHHLCTGELRTKYTARPYQLSATTPQCALLLCFETADSWAARELRAQLQLGGDAWVRQLRPLLDAGLLLAQVRTGRALLGRGRAGCSWRGRLGAAAAAAAGRGTAAGAGTYGTGTAGAGTGGLQLGGDAWVRQLRPLLDAGLLLAQVPAAAAGRGTAAGAGTYGTGTAGAGTGGLQLGGDAWVRQLRPLLDAGLLLAQGDVENEAPGESETAGDAPPSEGEGEGEAPPRGEGVLTLNLALSSKRTKIRLTTAATQHGGATGGGGGGAGGGAGAGGADGEQPAHCDDDRKMYLQAALVRIMKQRKVLRHNELIQEVVSQARGSFAPSVAMIKKCIEALIDKQYLERAPGRLDTYSYLA
ncbi:hypothetical protein MSG28_015275 [Choristoneura fumiferana]|uniref:Uncharacterized protein n=1 Tax=Choristoneura fumiferana TaxID=7141 RepID=A0ACC0K9S5_CHOFU|nr:hypothetical protein MSG28_015275 [Choristoneura fumiferana]